LICANRFLCLDWVQEKTFSNICMPLIPSLLNGWFAVSFLLISCQEPKEQARTLADALLTFELEEGFQIELIAGEPLISDPVDMEIDEYGRMYVVEMHGYPLDKSGSGRIKLLSDTDGDGVMDQSVVFADSLILPTGIMRWKKGVLVTDPPHVYYLEDSNGDGKADKREILLTGFAVSNPQHNVNSPRLGIDNWIYLGHEPAVTTKTYEQEFGDRGSEVHYPSHPGGIRLPQNAAGRSVRFQPEGYGLEVLASRTQFGHTFDDWGHRFVVNNSNHIIQDVIPARYLNRNPYLLVSESTTSISDHGNAAEVFPITKNPEHQLLTDVGVMTSACGITASQGGLFPSPYDRAVFVAEPVSNIVHLDLLSQNGILFAASRQHPEKEFLASTDSWFRPVNMYFGPDGALYVVDYYRQIIEHPEWMAEEVVSSGALYNGTDKGRIYRITPKGTKPLNWSNNLGMGDWSEEQWVEKLKDNSIWWRRNAQRLLIEKKSEQVPGSLIDLAQNPTYPVGRVHALWTLQGLGKLNSEWIRSALLDPEPGVRENAIRLAELHLDAFPELSADLLRLKTDQDPKVRFQLLCTLGFLDSPQAVQARNELLFQDLDKEWMQVAALSAPFEQSNQLMDAVLNAYQNGNPGYASLLQRLTAMTGASLDRDRILELIKRGTSNRIAGENSWQAPLLRGLALGIQSKKVPKSSFQSGEGMLVKAVFEHSALPVRQASVQLLGVIGISENPQVKATLDRAKKLAENKGLSEEERVLGVNFLALQNPEAYDDFLKSLIDPKEPLPVQLAAIKALGKIPDNSVAPFVLNQWASLTPEVRDEAINSLMANEIRMDLLLDALEKGTVQTSSLGWRRSVTLMNHSNEVLRTRARNVINKDLGKGEEILQQYQPALELKGTLANGRLVFENNCAVCHTMGTELGTAFGPDLSSLKNRRIENVMSDILIPNLSIADGYDLWSVELQNGESHQGIITSETPTAILLRSAGGLEKRIARQDIQTLKVLDLSGMPSGLEKAIDQQQMADLLAYILKIK
jgi:putative membrane-bound dehydrogenase-like protein